MMMPKEAGAHVCLVLRKSHVASEINSKWKSTGHVPDPLAQKNTGGWVPLRSLLPQSVSATQNQFHCAIANAPPPQARVIVIGGYTHEVLARPKPEPAQGLQQEQQ